MGKRFACRLPLCSPSCRMTLPPQLADVTLGAPVNGTVELAGPERLRLDELIRRFLSANQDTRQVVADVHARYFGAELNDHSLTPGDNPRIAPTRFEDWLSRSIASNHENVSPMEPGTPRASFVRARRHWRRGACPGRL